VRGIGGGGGGAKGDGWMGGGRVVCMIPFVNGSGKEDDVGVDGGEGACDRSIAG
jgi:hypothetical protein